MFIVVGFIAVLIGIFFCYAHKNRTENSETYHGIIIGIQEKVVCRGGIIRKDYRPLVKYSNGSKDIIAEHYNYMKLINLNHGKGETVLINVNPKMPKSFYFADEETRVSYEAIAAFAVGAAFIIVGIIMEMTVFA